MKLSPEESRRSLYFLNARYENFFEPKDLNLKTLIGKKRVDYVRYLALLSNYVYLEENVGNLARGYARKMEDFYTEYIDNIVNEKVNDKFKGMSADLDRHLVENSNDVYRKISNFCQIFDRNVDSIIDADIRLFGLLYYMLFKYNDSINITYDIGDTYDGLKQRIREKITACKQDRLHAKSPNALKYIKERIEISIDIYKEVFRNEQTS